MRKNLECDECMVVLEEDYIVDEDTVLKPDVVLICNEKGDFITKAPEVVVEVISSATAKRDERYKFEIYEKEKVKYYILAYPQWLKAKVFKLDGTSFEKVGDFSEEVVKLDELQYPTKIDFKKVFARFVK